MQLEVIDYGSTQYEKMVELRYQILRKPLDLEFSKEDLERDKDDLLLIMRYPNNGETVGCCILTRLTEHTVQLRQMAIAYFGQKKGWGSMLLDFAESVAVKHHYGYIYLHAREVAVGFYKKNGYTIEGNRFVEVGIPHYEMLKCIE